MTPEAYIARALFGEADFKLDLSIFNPSTGNILNKLDTIGRLSFVIDRQLSGFSALSPQLIEQLRLKILYRRYESSGPRDLVQVNLARLVILNIILALDYD